MAPGISTAGGNAMPGWPGAEAQSGRNIALGATLGRKGKFPLIDRGMALVSMAVAIVLGAGPGSVLPAHPVKSGDLVQVEPLDDDSRTWIMACAVTAECSLSAETRDG
jgi:hypothetical protein